MKGQIWIVASIFVALVLPGERTAVAQQGASDFILRNGKIITVDDRWCMLGSANMDVRSFRLNFESTALIYDASVTVELSNSIDRDVRRSRRIGLDDIRQRGLREQLIGGAARILSPLL